MAFPKQRRTPLLFKEKKIGKGHLTREKKKQEEDDFSVKIFHTKIMIYEDLTVQTQIRFQKRDL